MINQLIIDTFSHITDFLSIRQSCFLWLKAHRRILSNHWKNLHMEKNMIWIRKRCFFFEKIFQQMLKSRMYHHTDRELPSRIYYSTKLNHITWRYRYYDYQRSTWKTIQFGVIFIFFFVISGCHESDHYLYHRWIRL